MRNAQGYGPCKLTLTCMFAGDASMKNKNHSDKHRENFNARHNCSEKHDKSKVILPSRTHTLKKYLISVLFCVSTGRLLG
jgi:hypothetical protein